MSRGYVDADGHIMEKAEDLIKYLEEPRRSADPVIAIERIGPQACMFASDFPHEIPMEDALHEINEILERKDINDKHKSMILGENAKDFYRI